jgi:AcrR family transcriptional regulator
MAARGTKRGQGRLVLLATAQRLFDREGFHAVGIDRILAEAGIAKMTLYHHFPSKEALVVGVLESRDREVRASLSAALADRPARARLRTIFDWVERWVNDPEFRGSMFDKAAGEYGGSEHPVRRAVLAHKRWLFGEIQRAVIEAGGGNPGKLAAELFLLLEGAVNAAAVTGDRSAPRRARAAAETLLGGVLPG